MGDPRQRSEIFKIAHEVSTAKGFQYIATVNEDQIQPLLTQLGEAEFRAVFGKSVVLELKDDSPEDRLLGIEVDLDYD